MIMKVIPIVLFIFWGITEKFKLFSEGFRNRFKYVVLGVLSGVLLATII